ncbi:uncharacterized protein LOC134299686 [Anolis carolinensis]|uniref:uncharacterized protein LOC134299686 n=1 Tax=Anolis carolinensis TaxID=28377 RepID=UPI002F2B53EB
MAFPVFYSWWHNSNPGCIAPIPMVEASPVPQEEFVDYKAEEMDEEGLCWWTGELMLYYCLVATLVRMIYIGFEMIYRKKYCKQISKPISCNVQKIDKGCRCECEATLAFCSLFKKLFGGQQSNDLCSCRCVRKRIKACTSSLVPPAFSDCISSETEVSRKSSQKKRWSRAKEEQDHSGGSISSRKSHKAENKPKAQRETWVRQKECPRCKARRTREWLAQHFFDQE